MSLINNKLMIMMNQSHKSICSYYARTVVVMRKKKKKKNNKHKKHHDFYKKISGGENRELSTMFYIPGTCTSYEHMFDEIDTIFRVSCFHKK